MQFALCLSPSFAFSPWISVSDSKVRGWAPEGNVRLEPSFNQKKTLSCVLSACLESWRSCLPADSPSCCEVSVPLAVTLPCQGWQETTPWATVQPSLQENLLPSPGGVFAVSVYCPASRSQNSLEDSQVSDNEVPHLERKEGHGSHQSPHGHFDLGVAVAPYSC